jgi:hypothetical protein
MPPRPSPRGMIPSQDAHHAPQRRGPRPRMVATAKSRWHGHHHEKCAPPRSQGDATGQAPAGPQPGLTPRLRRQEKRRPQPAHPGLVSGRGVPQQSGAPVCPTGTRTGLVHGTLAGANMRPTIAGSKAAGEPGQPVVSGTDRLLLPPEFPSRPSRPRCLKPHPDLTRERTRAREALPLDSDGTGEATRSGWAALRRMIGERDASICHSCEGKLTAATAAGAHVRPGRRFNRPSDATDPAHLWTVCLPGHQEKTQMDRQVESRVRVRHEAHGCNER